MKTFILSIVLASVFLTVKAMDGAVIHTYHVGHSNNPAIPDSVKLKVDSNTAYYQKTVKVDSNIKVSMIYLRTLQFMSAKNFTQNYGYEEEGKMIFTTTQDLNANATFGGDNDDPNPYTVQFAITIDMKNGRYRYTISNVIFYLPTVNGNRRMTLYELFEKEIGGESRRIQRNAKTIVDSFERYLVSLTGELYTEIEHKAVIYQGKF
ncbi:MAG TPA: hypothetical protein VFE54_07380 [Mucilaginibacter sp.]|nr:hypothetical protein [Mucilaginibacter sp.]